MNLTTKNKFLIGAGIVVLVFLLWLATSYNGLVKASLGVDNAWADIEAQYQRRFDLIPRLVNTTSAYAQFEKSTLTEITQLRSQWGAALNPEEKIKVANQWDSAISRLLMVFENYPNLKTVEPLRALQDELAGTENRIAVSRLDYNSAVRNYNLAIKVFPASLLASSFGFKEKTYFQAVGGADNAPPVPSTLG